MMTTLSPACLEHIIFKCSCTISVLVLGRAKPSAGNVLSLWGCSAPLQQVLLQLSARPQAPLALAPALCDPGAPNLRLPGSPRPFPAGREGAFGHTGPSGLSAGGTLRSPSWGAPAPSCSEGLGGGCRVTGLAKRGAAHTGKEQHGWHRYCKQHSGQGSGQHTAIWSSGDAGAAVLGCSQRLARGGWPGISSS